MKICKSRIKLGNNTIVSMACLLAMGGCASAERNFGTPPGGSEDASAAVDEDGGSVVSYESDAGIASSVPNSQVSSSSEDTQPTETTGADLSSGPPVSNVTTAVSSEVSPTTGDSESSSVMDSTSNPVEPGGTEDAAYPYSCVALCQGSFHGDTALLASKTNGLRIVVPQSPCAAECASEVVEIAAGGEHTCARRGDGSVKCWGNGLQGRLGLGDILWHGSGPNEMGEALPAVDLGSGRMARAVSTGHDHTCALLDDWSVKCWGANAEGQLGLGDTDDRGDAANEMGDALPAVDLGAGRTATAISAGHRDTCAVLDGGDVKCWGQDELGKLGQGNSGSLGDQSGEMGDALAVVNLGAGLSAVSVEATYQHTCAVLSDGSLKCWGYENAGRLGREGNDATGDDTAEMGDRLPVVDLGSGKTAVSVGLGYLHSCAVLGAGNALKCWGYGQGGRLGLGDAMSRGDGPNQMGDALPEVPLGLGVAVRRVAPGDEHTCTLTTSGAVKCWGVGSWGRLGSGEESDRGDEANEMGDHLPNVALGTGLISRAIASGYRHSCALLDNGAVKCWGEGGAGRLGLGDEDDRGDEPGEMGDALPSVALW